MDIKIRQYAEEDVKETIAIWNEVVKRRDRIPQKETLTESTGDLFFKEQTFTGIAYDEREKRNCRNVTFCIRIISSCLKYCKEILCRAIYLFTKLSGIKITLAKAFALYSIGSSIRFLCNLFHFPRQYEYGNIHASMTNIVCQDFACC